MRAPIVDRLRAAAQELRDVGLLTDADLMIEAAVVIDGHRVEIVEDRLDLSSTSG